MNVSIAYYKYMPTIRKKSYRVGEIVANHISDKKLISRMQKVLKIP